MSEEITADSLLTIATKANLDKEASIASYLDSSIRWTLRYCQDVSKHGRTVARIDARDQGVSSNYVECILACWKDFDARMSALGFNVSHRVERGNPGSLQLTVDWTHPKK